MHRSLINLAAAIFAMAVLTAAIEEERQALRGGGGGAVINEHQQQQDDRDLMMCSNNEDKVFRLDLTTDGSGSSTSYIIEQYDNGSWNKYVEEKKHDDYTRYNRRICVAPGDYRLTISKSGNSCYSAYLRGKKLNDNSGCGDSTSYFALGQSQFNEPPSSPNPPPDTPNPTMRPTPLPTPLPTPRPVKEVDTTPISGRIADCGSDERLVSIEIKLDAFGEETSWTLQNAQGNVLLRNSRTYAPHDYEIKDICLPPASNYALIVKDPYDGICCEERDNCSNWREEKNCVGYYKIIVDGTEVLRAGEYIFGSKKHEFNLEPHTMTERDTEWLEAHNERRQKWHKDYGKDYVPLKWSNNLKASSQIWLRELLDVCSYELGHDPSNKKWGENLASNYGTGDWAAVKSPDEVVSRFVEWEADLPWPRNAHLTQVLWLNSRHVGCADGTTTVQSGPNEGMTCHVQVCRYARAGNCAMSSFDDGSDEWWMNAVMNEKPSRCGEECPPEGCHYY